MRVLRRSLCHSCFKIFTSSFYCCSWPFSKSYDRRHCVWKWISPLRNTGVPYYWPTQVYTLILITGANTIKRQLLCNILYISKLILTFILLSVVPHVRSENELSGVFLCPWYCHRRQSRTHDYETSLIFQRKAFYAVKVQATSYRTVRGAIITSIPLLPKYLSTRTPIPHRVALVTFLDSGALLFQSTGYTSG